MMNENKSNNIEPLVVDQVTYENLLAESEKINKLNNGEIVKVQIDKNKYDYLKRHFAPNYEIPDCMNKEKREEIIIPIISKGV